MVIYLKRVNKMTTPKRFAFLECCNCGNSEHDINQDGDDVCSNCGTPVSEFVSVSADEYLEDEE